MTFMASLRKLRTASGATAVQLVRYHKRKLVVIKYVGSAHHEEELKALLEIAKRLRKDYDLQQKYKKR